MSESNETGEQPEVWLRWHWRHHALCLDVCESLDEALIYFKGGHDYGTEAIGSLEGPGGVRLDEEDIFQRICAMDDEEEEAESSRPEPTHYVSVSLNGDSASAGWHHSESKAQADADRINAVFPGRATVVTR